MNDFVELAAEAPPAADGGSLARLSEFASRIASYRDLEDCIAQLVALVARIFDAETCAIALVPTDHDRNLRLFTNHSRTPAAPATEQIAHVQCAATRVLASGAPELFAVGQDSIAAAPIRVEASIMGVIGVVRPQQPLPFGPADLRQLEIVSRFIDKSVEVIQLRCLLNSRLAQLSLLAEAGVPQPDKLPVAVCNPDQLASLVARSFYREMARAGFCSRQIIGAATEIIAQLTNNIQQNEHAAAPAGLPQQRLDRAVKD